MERQIINHHQRDSRRVDVATSCLSRPSSRARSNRYCGKSIAREVRATFLLALIAFQNGCITSKTVKWQEEVKLGTGEVIVIKRETHFKPGGAEIAMGSGWTPKSSVIRFRYPPSAGPEIEWRTRRESPRFFPELPMVLDVEPAGPVVITHNDNNLVCGTYHRYRYENGAWRDDPLPEEFPARPPSLSLAGLASKMPRFVSLADQQRENADRRYAPRYRQVGPKREICGD